MKKLVFMLACVALVAVAALMDFEPISSDQASNTQPQVMQAPKKSGLMGFSVPNAAD